MFTSPTATPRSLDAAAGRVQATAPGLIRALLFLGLCSALLPGSARTQESSEQQPAEASIEVVEVVVQPTQPGPDTLCTLTVRLRNRGPRPASALAFDVAIDGNSLAVYEKQVFMTLVPPTSSGGDDASGDTTGGLYDLRLFNFWTSDSQRPAPTDGELDVRVRLVEAQWVDVRVEEDGTEVWALDGSVPGLPMAATISVSLAQN